MTVGEHVRRWTEPASSPTWSERLAADHPWRAAALSSVIFLVAPAVMLLASDLRPLTVLIVVLTGMVATVFSRHVLVPRTVRAAASRRA